MSLPVAIFKKGQDPRHELQLVLGPSADHGPWETGLRCVRIQGSGSKSLNPRLGVQGLKDFCSCLRNEESLAKANVEPGIGEVVGFRDKGGLDNQNQNRISGHALRQLQ